MSKVLYGGRTAVGIICRGGLLSLLPEECYDRSVLLRTLL